MKNRMIFGFMRLIVSPVSQFLDSDRGWPACFSGANAEPLLIACQARKTR